MSNGITRSYTMIKQGGMIPSLFKGWKEWKVGDTLIAEFIETKMGSYNGQPTPNHLCKVIECNFTIRTKDGSIINPTDKVLTLNSAGQLNKVLEGAEKGATFALTYEGKKRSNDPKNPQLYHTFSEIGIVELGTESNEAHDVL